MYNEIVEKNYKMKITKYPQSCMMIEANNQKILVDAGTLKYKDKYLEEWK